MEKLNACLIEWGVASRALAGNEISGDSYVVKIFGEKALVAALDGLGHGTAAAEASAIAVRAIENSRSEDPAELLRECHESLKGSQGVVLSLALLNARNNSVTWAGIGNVEGILKRSSPEINPLHETLFLTNGILGYHFQSIRPSVLDLEPGDTLIFATDGIRSGFARDVNPADSPRRIAGQILQNYNTNTDDALVLAVRYPGGRSNS